MGGHETSNLNVKDQTMKKGQSTAKTSSKKARTKPRKPRKDFPLFPHANGQWCKKIRGRLHFFGVWDDPQAALATWLEDKDYLLAGEERPSRVEGVTVGEIADEYYEAQSQKTADGELAEITLESNKRTCKRLVEALGLHTPIEALTPNSFSNLRSTLSTTLSARSLGIELQRIRSIFSFAVEQGLTDRPPRYGTSFKKPSEKAVRRERNKLGSQMFEADEIRDLLEVAGMPLKAMILLGVNCGFGNRDIAILQKSSVNLKTGVIDFPRPKTEVRRYVTLWPETIAALKEASKMRPAPKDKDDEKYWFITSHGECYVRFAKNGGWRDAVRQYYRQRISDDRLRAVTDHVRKWLFPKDPARKK